MLEKIREGSQGLMIKVVLGAVILSFALAGIGSYIGRPAENLAAVVNGQKIRHQELEQAYQNQRARMEAQLGDMFSQLAANEGYIQQLRASALENLIDEALLDQAVANAGIRISDEQVKENITSMKEFQRDGKFDNDRYLALIRNAGYSVSGFREVLRGQMARAQLVGATVDSEFVLPGESSTIARLLDQKRTIRYWTIDTNKLAGSVVPTAEQLQAHYDENQFSYKQAEQVSLEYIELNAKALEANVTITDEDVEQFYTDNSSRYVHEEERKVAHILIGNDKDDAQAKAEALLTKVNAGDDFAALAKANSDDTFSAQNGGELDSFGKGVMDPAFEAAAFALAQSGDVSGVVESQFGFHIIKLINIKPEKLVPLAEIKDDVIAELKQEKALEQFYELQQTISDLAFEVPDTLMDAAGAAELEVKSSPLFMRNQAPAPLDHPKLNDAAFSEAVLLDGMNSDIIETQPGQLFVVRLKEHQSARSLPFEEVTAQVTEQVKQKQAQAQADEIAQQLKALIADGSKIEQSWLQNNHITANAAQTIGRFDNLVPAAIRTASFDAMRKDNGSSLETTKYAGAVAIVAVDAVTDSNEPIADMLTQLEPRLVAQKSELAYKGMIAVLRADAEISYPRVVQQ